MVKFHHGDINSKIRVTANNVNRANINNAARARSNEFGGYKQQGEVFKPVTKSDNNSYAQVKKHLSSTPNGSIYLFGVTSGSRHAFAGIKLDNTIHLLDNLPFRENQSLFTLDNVLEGWDYTQWSVTVFNR